MLTYICILKKYWKHITVMLISQCQMSKKNEEVALLQTPDIIQVLPQLQKKEN